LDRPTPTLVPCWSLNPCLQGTSVGAGLPQPVKRPLLGVYNAPIPCLHTRPQFLPAPGGPREACTCPWGQTGLPANSKTPSRLPPPRASRHDHGGITNNTVEGRSARSDSKAPDLGPNIQGCSPALRVAALVDLGPGLVFLNRCETRRCSKLSVLMPRVKNAVLAVSP
jgi:hypothetical protein